jgi:type IV pilus assembly protein PilX
MIGISKQRGVALIVSLLLLLAITMLVMSGSRNTNIQERMSANLYDRELSFQASESAVRAAEQWLMANPNTDCTASAQCYMTPDPNDPVRWMDPATVWQTATVNLGSIVASPEFIIEDMGGWPEPPDCARGSTIPPGCLSQTYRITARSNAEGRSQTMLQVLFRR